MNARREEYKGYEVVEYLSNMGRFHVMPHSADFREDGYSTANNAKGAITKYLKANNAMHRDDLTVNERAAAQSKAATSDDKARASVPVRERDGAFDDYQGPDNPAASTANLMQQLTYHGFLKHGKPVTSQKYLSRNKREGKYAGKTHGLHVRSRDTRFNGPSAMNAGTVALYK